MNRTVCLYLYIYINSEGIDGFRCFPNELCRNDSPYKVVSALATQRSAIHMSKYEHKRCRMNASAWRDLDRRSEFVHIIPRISSSSLMTRPRSVPASCCTYTWQHLYSLLCPACDFPQCIPFPLLPCCLCPSPGIILAVGVLFCIGVLQVRRKAEEDFSLSSCDTGSRSFFLSTEQDNKEFLFILFISFTRWHGWDSFL